MLTNTASVGGGGSGTNSGSDTISVTQSYLFPAHI
jgi:hypothetical protein